MTEPTKPRPKVNSESQKELDKAQEQFEKFDDQVKSLTMDRMSAAPKEETEGPKVSQKEIDKTGEVYLKPMSTIFAVDPKTGKTPTFNEKFRDDYNFQKEFVKFIFENNEIKGETTEIWTLPFPGLPAQRWVVPTNVPVWGPRYLAEQIKRCFYHRLKMEDRPPQSTSQSIQYYGAMAVDSTIQRLDAHPVSNRKSVFMGANGF